jgi:alpha-ketoglutarate-dependent sulfate ester dioxygenase
VWANTVEAYRRLHPALQAMVARLRAVRSNLYDYAAQRTFNGVDVNEQRYRDEFRHLEFETEHPVVRIHPDTGEPSLLLGHFVRSSVGLSTLDSADLFQLLQRQVTRLENTVRWDLAARRHRHLDNRATQHYAVADYDDLPRLMHRITVAGPVPAGISGDTSLPLKGDASFYSWLAAASPDAGKGDALGHACGGIPRRVWSVCATTSSSRRRKWGRAAGTAERGLRRAGPGR